MLYLADTHPLHFMDDQRKAHWVCTQAKAKQQQEWHKSHKLLHPYCPLCIKEAQLPLRQQQ